jgi:hypothetical protein
MPEQSAAGRTPFHTPFIFTVAEPLEFLPDLPLPHDIANAARIMNTNNLFIEISFCL